MKRGILIITIFALLMVSTLSNLPKVYAPNPSAVTTGPYKIASDAWTWNVHDFGVIPKMFFAQNRWWVFYGGAAGASQKTMNYTTASDPTGTWTEYGVRSINFTIRNNNDFSVDNNETNVFFSFSGSVATPNSPDAYFMEAKLNSDGTITNYGLFQKVMPCKGNVANPCPANGLHSDDTQVLYESSTKKVYLFSSFENVTAGSGQDMLNYTVSTNAAHTTWAAQQQLKSKSCRTNGWFPQAVDTKDGHIYVMYWNWYYPATCGGVGSPQLNYFGRVITGATMGSEETLPVLSGWYSAVPYARYGSIFSTSTGTVTAAIRYGSANAANDTFAQTPLFTTRPAGGPWGSIAPAAGALLPAQGSNGYQAPSASYCETFIPSLGQYVGSKSGYGDTIPTNDMWSRLYSSSFTYYGDTNKVTIPGGVGLSGFGGCAKSSPKQLVQASQNGTSADGITCNTACTLWVSVTALSSFASSTSPEPQKVLFADDFLYTNVLLSSPWVIDRYTSQNGDPGIWTSSGYLNMKGHGEALSITAHIANPSYTVAGNNDGTIIKRKLTAAGVQFGYKAANDANIRVGLGPMLTAGAFPSGIVFGTPDSDLTNNCATSTNAADNIGIAYIVMDDSGAITLVSCGDGGSQRTAIETVDPTIYTVFTVETSAVYCSTCLDNQVYNSSWVWGRAYQIDTKHNNVIINDKSINITTPGKVTPLANTNYLFTSLQMNGNVLNNARIDYINLQNFGSPVCLNVPGGLLCTRFPYIVTQPFSTTSFIDTFAWLANAIGAGDAQIGALVLYFGLSLGIGAIAIVLTRSYLFTGTVELCILGFFVYAGFLPTWTLFPVVLLGSVLAVLVVLRMAGATGGIPDLGGSSD